MTDEERADFQTRFKKGQSGNPGGRPKGRMNNALLLRDVLFKPIRVKDGETVRSLPKLVVAAQVCLNNALKGDLRSFVKLMEIAQKFALIDRAPPEERVTAIELIIVDPKNPTEESYCEKSSEAEPRGL